MVYLHLKVSDSAGESGTSATHILNGFQETVLNVKNLKVRRPRLTTWTFYLVKGIGLCADGGSKIKRQGKRL